jgi:hypothetical protein
MDASIDRENLRLIRTCITVALIGVMAGFQAQAAENDATAVPASQTPQAAAAAQPVDREKCKAAAEAFGKRAADKAQLDTEEARSIANDNPQLVFCHAVLTDSDQPCKQFFPEEHGPSAACLEFRALFHELRTYPDKPTYLFTDYDWERCRSSADLRDTCDKLRNALRSGTEASCAGIGIGEPLCRAAISGDKSKCGMKVAVDRAQISLPDAKEGEKNTIDVAEWVAADCREKMDSRAWLKPGLKALAKNGPARQRVLAQAALGEADACASLVKDALAKCGPAPGDVTPAATPAEPLVPPTAQPERAS